MAHTIGTLGAHTSSAANPATQSVTVAPAETLLVLLLKTAGATDRAGGAPTFNGVAMLQAGTTQKAAASPECGAELWYYPGQPPVGTFTLSIPNTGTATLFWRACAASAPAGGGSRFSAASGGNATGTNPTSTLSLGEPACICFAIVASGAQTWASTARNGTLIGDHDDGAHGTGYQYVLNVASPGTQQMGWTFATSDDYGTCAAAFAELPASVPQNYKSVTVGDGLATNERIR